MNWGYITENEKRNKQTKEVTEKRHFALIKGKMPFDVKKKLKVLLIKFVKNWLLFEDCVRT